MPPTGRVPLTLDQSRKGIFAKLRTQHAGAAVLLESTAGSKDCPVEPASRGVQLREREVRLLVNLWARQESGGALLPTGRARVKSPVVG